MNNPGFRGPDPFAHGPARPAGQPGSGPTGYGAPAAGGYPGQAPFGGPPVQPPVAVTSRTSPPVTVWCALLFVAVAAALCLVQAGLGIRAMSQDGRGEVYYLGREVADLSTTAIVFTVVLAALFALAYASFGYAVWRGAGWTAPLGTVLAALSLFGLMGGWVIIALVVAGILAVVFLWLPPSREFARITANASATASAAYDPWAGR
ncbi:hypothetical protein GOARA_015_00040 [Gordonia araii NBRC 100433]|uniref:Uncharacterized protein n=1 Tax=Gordonia araii NBRC 100433 TaxID=1073574 RepID=G7GYJ1_9ACTN|nr:hypothetical protein [Gordonia araii]NNG97474.1 hypothetical protein [Gordonia araii NBRC 100433]GAB08666.1 hypothetical protein GOARA_015_00040 [Gordonia araii NBRC 100433]